MSPKERICGMFKKTPFRVYGDIPMDPQLVSLMEEINISPDIVTLNSCTGHKEEEKGYNCEPYLAFRVSEKGWNLFWRKILPRLAENTPIEVVVIDDPEKFCIRISTHIEYRENFWDDINSFFTKYFLKEIKNEEPS